MQCSILSERRAFQPYGLLGGSPGARGMNLLTLHGEDGRVVNLGGKNTVVVSRGDQLTIMSPGGGGYGDPAKERDVNAYTTEVLETITMTSGSLNDYSMNQLTV